MASNSFLFCVLAIWVFHLAPAASSSAHHAPAPSVDCSSLILNMADCLTFVSNGSTISKPEGHCCSGLKTVLKADPSCLCEAFKSSAQFGIVLNVSKAATLPAVCKLSAPSISNCGLSLSPAGAPGPAAPGPMDGGAGAASELSPTAAPAPSPGNSASSLLPISVLGPLLISIHFLRVLTSELS